MELPQKRTAQDTCFGVLDSSTYEQIHSHDTEKAVIQVCGSFMSIIIVAVFTVI